MNSINPPEGSGLFGQSLRLPPQNIEAEQALLGALLSNNKAFERVSEFLAPDHFVDPIHARIFSAIRRRVENNALADVVTLKGEFEHSGVLEEVGGTTYLVQLVSATVGIINAGEYGRLIHDCWIRRQLIDVGETVVNRAFGAEPELEGSGQIEAAEQQLFDLATGGANEGGAITFDRALALAVEAAAKAKAHGGGVSGLPSGLRDVDARLGGLHGSDLLILAGRPGMGKTALATNIAFNIAKAYASEKLPDGTTKRLDGGIVGFFSLEMSSEQLATRVIAEQSGVASYKIRRGEIREDEFNKIADAAREMERIPFYIDQTGGISIAQLTARARRLKRQKGLDILVVDYLQLLSGSAKKGENRVQELTEITTGLKALAKELAVPIIALSQLSRQVEQRDDKRPQLSDLRESGSIEQDADVVLFVYREEYYMKNKEPKIGTEEYFKWQTEMEQVHGRAEVIIGKQRHGPTGTVALQFEAEITRFTDLAQEDRLPERME